MNEIERRGFLGAALAAAAGLVLDPERLLWVPGRKLISLPQSDAFWVTCNGAIFDGSILRLQHTLSLDPLFNVEVEKRAGNYALVRPTRKSHHGAAFTPCSTYASFRSSGLQDLPSRWRGAPR